jgi:hypothetical protein
MENELFNRQHRFNKKFLIFPVLLIMLLFVSCQPGPSQTPEQGTRQPTPTINSFFSNNGKPSQGSLNGTDGPQTGPTVSGIFGFEATPTQIQTSTSIPTIAVVDSTQTSPLSYSLKVVYDDEFDPDWRILDNAGVDYTNSTGSYVFQGEKSLAVTPRKDFGTLFFAVKPQNQTSFPRQRVLGLSFWINGGENSIQIGDLAVAIVGSNDLAYYLPDDHSAYVTSDPPFSETRLYYLGFNRSIPPKTWVKVQVWLADLIYDPIYKYVTGFYIKNDKGFYQTYYVDDFSLTMLKDDNATLPPQSLTLAPKATTTPLISNTPTLTQFVTVTRTSTATRLPTRTPPPTRTPVPTTTRLPTWTLTPTWTPSLTRTLTNTPTPTSTKTATPTPTASATPK